MDVCICKMVLLLIVFVPLCVCHSVCASVCLNFYGSSDKNMRIKVGKEKKSAVSTFLISLIQ